MKVLVIGSGGREHSLVKAIKTSSGITDLVCAPGNGGIEKDCRCVNIAVDDLDAIINYITKEGVDFVICGPEVPLSMGLGDKVRKEGILFYGPNQDGARLEASKAYSKEFLAKHKIPTAEGKSFDNFAKAKEYIEKVPFDVVIKASGLAAGKGVVIPDTKQEAIQSAKDMLESGVFGDSGKEIVVEEKMVGQEASIMLMLSGKNYVMLPASQDHKRVGEGDTGLNTGGMGAYAPADIVDDVVEKDIVENIINPTIKGLIKDGIDYRGTLYIGVMLTAQGAKVVEFNVRFGDPETQVLMPLIESDVLEVFLGVASAKLDPSTVKIKDKYSVVVVMCAGGYPDKYRKGDTITFAEDVEDKAWVVHAGTKMLTDNSIVSCGGRVLGLVGIADTLQEACDNAYSLADKTSFEGSFFRRDIAYKQLKKNS